MKQTYLIQRLLKPVRVPEGQENNPLVQIAKEGVFCFGGGLVHGGLSKKAWNTLSPIFSFDYMGAAEFEFGALPEALRTIQLTAPNFTTFEIEFDPKKIPLDKFEKKRYSIPDKATAYVFCNKNDEAEVRQLITDLVFDPKRELALTERANLRTALLRRTDGRVHFEACGWVELDNGFFFFTDKEMFDKLVKVFSDEPVKA